MAPVGSESEGEIVDQSGLSKAKIAQQSSNSTSVDKRPSTSAASIPAKNTFDHARSHSPFRSPRPSSRRRSRSPPRRDERQTYRTREDDRLETRYPREPQHNQRYNERDGGTSYRSGGGKDGLPYDDPYESNLSAESEGDGYGHTRYSRDYRRSDSYGRGYGRDTRYDRSYDRNSSYSRDYDRERSPRYDSRVPDRYGRDRKLTGSRNDAGSKPGQHLGMENIEKHQHLTHRATGKEGGRGNARATLSTDTLMYDTPAESGVSKVSKSIKTKSVEDFAPIVVDEEAEIERRRKKRQEVKARLGVQDTDLRIQAIEHAASSRQVTPATELVATQDSASGIASMASDATKPVSVPKSPSPNISMAPGVSNSTSMAASRATSEEQNSSSAAASPHASADFHIPGVSAADYDPVQEQKENLDRAAQNAETTNIDQVADDGQSDDMFADDFDVNRVNNKPRELDMNLIEDHDDEASYYRITVHELIDNRYVVRGELGKGSYAVVVLAFDKVTQKDIALKIFRKNDHIRQAGLKELDTLKRLIDADPECDQHIVGFYRSFYYKKHLCLVFERLEGDVRGLVKTAGHGLALSTVVKLAKDMFLALDFLKRCKFIHADLKPDNMLFYNNRQNLKFGDLGIAYKAADAVLHPMDNAGSRFYRSPEALLGIPHSYGIDIWAIACSLYEVFSGQVLFPGRHNNEMLEAIMDIRGKIPHSLQKRGKLSWHHFNQIDGLFKQAIELDTEGRPYSWRVRTDIRQHPTRDIKARVLAAARIKNLDTEETKKARQFADLLDKCLRMDPEKRIGPGEALQHPLFESI